LLIKKAKLVSDAINLFGRAVVFDCSLQHCSIVLFVLSQYLTSVPVIHRLLGWGRSFCGGPGYVLRILLFEDMELVVICRHGLACLLVNLSFIGDKFGVGVKRVLGLRVFILFFVHVIFLKVKIISLLLTTLRILSARFPASFFFSCCFKAFLLCSSC